MLIKKETEDLSRPHRELLNAPISRGKVSQMGKGSRKDKPVEYDSSFRGKTKGTKIDKFA